MNPASRASMFSPSCSAWKSATSASTVIVSKRPAATCPPSPERPGRQGCARFGRRQRGRRSISSQGSRPPPNTYQLGLPLRRGAPLSVHGLPAHRPPAAPSVLEASCSESEFVPGGLGTGVAHGRRRRGRRSASPQGRMAATPPYQHVRFPARSGAAFRARGGALVRDEPR